MLYSVNEQIQVRCTQLEDRQGSEAPSNETYLLNTQEYLKKTIERYISGGRGLSAISTFPKVNVATEFNPAQGRTNV